MPVDRPARDSGRGGDLLERRAGHSLAGENLARGGQDVLPCALGFLFCSTQVGGEMSLTYIRDCILECWVRINSTRKDPPHGVRSLPAGVPRRLRPDPLPYGPFPVPPFPPVPRIPPQPRHTPPPPSP